jgi:site-specific recombinase XerD
MSYLEEMGYSEKTRVRLFAYYKVFLKYANSRNLQNFNSEVGKTFLLKHHHHKWDDKGRLSGAQNFLQRHMLILYEFQKHGEIVSKKRRKRTYAIAHFSEIINEYLEYHKNSGLKESTISGKRHALSQIFEFLENNGIKSTKDITQISIYDFLESRSYYSISTKEHYQYILRSLINYLNQKNLCKPELLKLFSVISIHTKNAYPSCFKPDEISKTLQSVNTSTNIGKRDYLVLLLASQLGMRVSDICKLKIENINFKKQTIEYVQTKTGVLVNLPLSEELFYAIADYIKNARPNCYFKELLISERAPVQPFVRNFYDRLKKYLHDSEVNVITGQRRGLHSLRSSLASNMLRDGVSIPVISNVLGHKYYDTTSDYIKIDILGLRKAALEVPYDRD